MILLISRSALRSVEFQREIEHAHKIGCRMLPLLVELPREEYEKLAPAWCSMLGASPMIEYRRTEPLPELIGRIKASAQALDIGIDPEMAVTPVRPAAQCSGQIWATDANQIDIVDLDRVLFRNASIDDFLTSKHRHFISATKGFGKTLLLTCKRHLLTRSSASGSQQITMVPEGRPFLDFMSEMRSASRPGTKSPCRISRIRSACGALPSALRRSRTFRRPSNNTKRRNSRLFPGVSAAGLTAQGYSPPSSSRN